jgi:formate hydrogenlyase subunit 3/multisubunit Na+/H+ antiporter MnhD subunit
VVTQTLHSLLPTLLVLLPLLAAALVRPVGRRSERLRNTLVATVTAGTLLGAAALLWMVAQYGPIVADGTALAGGIGLAADAFGALFALFSAFVWFCATLFSFDYLREHAARDRYHAVSLVALSANLGVVLADSLLTLFVFFEVLGLVAFLLVVHTGTEEARKASIQYLWMTVLGGVALLAGILLVQSMGGGAIGPVPLAPGLEQRRGWAAALLVLGFGVKAGMLPVHVWLPNAHPVAPSPASALLSGVMIKAGAYGIFRCLFFVLRPEGAADLADPDWRFASDLGLVVLWIGIATMAVGVVSALGQRNAKRMLAYHSISQMGFILTGLGVGAYLAGEGSLGIAGGLLHAVNHALFKGCLFLGIGAVVLRTGRLDMYELGGLWRRMPVTFAVMVVAAAGITGVPLFNGFVSKCMIHHALLEAHAAEQLVALRVAERVYVLVCAGTAASFIKLIGLVFLGRSRGGDVTQVREAPAGMLVAMMLLAAAVVALGLWPGVLLGGVLGPGLQGAGLPAAGVAHFLDHDLFSTSDVALAFAALALGAVVFWSGIKTGLFHLKLPRGFALEDWYARIATAVLAGCRLVAVVHASLQHTLARWLQWLRRHAAVRMHDFARARQRFGATIFTGAPGTEERNFIEDAWLTLDRERHATIRTALAEVAGPQPAGRAAGASVSESVRESVRAIAGHMAALLFDQRMAVLVELVRGGAAEKLPPALERVAADLARSRTSIARAAPRLAARRRAGADIAPMVVAALQPIVVQDDFDARLRAAMGLPASASKTAVNGGRGRGPYPGPASLVERRARGAGTVPSVVGWAVDVLRLAAATLRQPPETLPYSEHAHPDPVVMETRRCIHRFVRHPGLGVAIIFLTLVVVFAWITQVTS